MATKIPLDELIAAAGNSFTIELVGDVFRLDFRYNDRDQRYYLSIFDEDNSPIVLSVKVLLGFPLIARVTDPRRPKGDFIAVDVGAAAEPTIGTLGAGVDLVFVSWAEAIGIAS